MKKFLLLTFLLYSLPLSKAFSQDFLGLSTGNYSGITGVMIQPASIVDSRFKFDINLFSSGVNYSNNFFLLDRDVILKFNKNKYEDYNTFKDRYLSKATLAPGEKAFFNINNRTQLPLSFMATTGKNSAIALNMQFRTMIQGRNITQDFADLAFNNFNPSTGNPSISASGISINSLSWAEAGLTYGRVLYDGGNHFLKIAVTGKYMAGLSSISLSAEELQMQVNSDSTFNFKSPYVSYNHSSNADYNKLFKRDLSSNATAIGFDAGLVYEFRGNIDKFKYIKGNDEKSYDAIRRDVNKYIFKVGVSLLDVGMFQFDKPNGVNSFSANINNWDIKNGNYKSLKDFDMALASRVIASPKDERRYNVYLPTALSAQMDIKFVNGLFLNAMSYWPVSLGSNEGKRFDNFGFYTITPRYETRHFGIYIPYTVGQQNDFSDYKQHLLGLTLRAGPLFIGSSNLGTMLFKDKLSAADVHLGLKVGVTYGKPNKSNKLLGNLFAKNQAATTIDEYQPESDYPKEALNVKERDNNKKPNTKQYNNRGLILDYKTQKVYDNPDVKQNLIVINNNYYYGNTQGLTKSDTINIAGIFPNYNADSLGTHSLEMFRLQNKKTADSIYKVTQDSLEIKRIQLDSLIRSMQRLQTEMNNQSQIMDSINTDRMTASANTILANGQKLKAIKSTEIKKKDTLVQDRTAGNLENIKTQEDQVSNAEKLQVMRNQQNQLYQKYAEESARLGNDISMLNKRLIVTDQNRRSIVNYIPVPVVTPYNNSRNFQQEIRPAPIPVKVSDTVYIRDTVTIFTKDSILNRPLDTVQKIIKITELKTDTIKIKEPVNYAAMPEDYILFAIGKSAVQPNYNSRLNYIADILKKKSNLQVIVTGHTDATGSKAINEKLSLQRAEAVSYYLMKKGVPAKQIVVNSLASEDPAVSGSTQTARSQNRRVVLQLKEK